MKYYEVDGILYRSDTVVEKYSPGQNQWIPASRAKAETYGRPLSESEARDLWPDAF